MNNLDKMVELGSDRQGRLNTESLGGFSKSVFEATQDNRSGVVIGANNLSFQRLTDKSYVSAYFNNNGDASLTGQFNYSKEYTQGISGINQFDISELENTGTAYISGSAEISTNANNNHIMINAGLDRTHEGTRYQAKAGVGAFGSDLKVKALAAGDIEHSLNESGMTRVFVNASMKYDDGHKEIDFKTGVRHGVLEAGVQHDAITHETKALIGFTKDL